MAFLTESHENALMTLSLIHLGTAHLEDTSPHRQKREKCRLPLKFWDETWGITRNGGISETWDLPSGQVWIHPSIHPSICPSIHPSIHPSLQLEYLFRNNYVPRTVTGAAGKGIRYNPCPWEPHGQTRETSRELITAPVRLSAGVCHLYVKFFCL